MTSPKRVTRYPCLTGTAPEMRQAKPRRERPWLILVVGFPFAAGAMYELGRLIARGHW